jgi:hypothetical protein
MAYDAPTPADLIARYPAFAQVDPATISYWLTDSLRYVDTSWMEQDYAPALIAHAAYEMAKRGIPGIATSAAASAIGQGLSRWRSGSADLQFSDEAVKVALAGGYGVSIYGMEYCELLARNKIGIGVTAPGRVPFCNAGFNGFAGPLPPWV